MIPSNISKALREKEIRSIDLDDLVHDLASKMASTINNNGTESQAQFIMRRMSVEAFENWIGLFPNFDNLIKNDPIPENLRRGLPTDSATEDLLKGEEE